MPAIAEYIKPTNAFVWNVFETESILQPQGSEGKQLSRKADEAFQHWTERAEVLIAVIDVADAVSYVSVPPNRTMYVKTRYVFAGSGEVLPFELEDE